MGIARNLLGIDYDEVGQLLIAVERSRKRTSLVTVRPALNGYQKGRCFYCFAPISIDEPLNFFYPDVDHFFPHTLKQVDCSGIDSVWNLVLSCKACNREKGARIPTMKLLERLYSRNEFLIASHHPLRETLIMQTGKNEIGRGALFLKFMKSRIGILGYTWARMNLRMHDPLPIHASLGRARSKVEASKGPGIAIRNRSKEQSARASH
jgi:hypothetical protein